MEHEVPHNELSNLPRHAWVVKACENYKDELKDCQSIKGRFHQYFIHGETLDCSEWGANYASCKKFRKERDIESLQQVINSEVGRKVERLKAHYENDIWERRTSPPESWNAPIPKQFIRSQESSLLQAKAKEFEEETMKKTVYYSPSICCIS